MSRTVQFTPQQAAGVRPSVSQHPSHPSQQPQQPQLPGQQQGWGPQPPAPPPPLMARQGPQAPGPMPGLAGPRVEHPMLSPMYWACADLLAFAPQLAHGESLPAPDALRATCRGMFTEMGRRCYESNIPPEDIRDAQYAIAALFDEQILRGQWPGRAEWNANLLQFIYFQENTAGEGFFRRLDVLRGEPHRAHVLQIYFLCLAMGFQGRYQMMGGEGLANVLEQTAASLDRYVPPSDVISPNGLPSDLGRNVLTSDMPLIRIGIGIVALAIVAFIALKVVVGFSASSANTQMKNSASSLAHTP